MHERKYLFGINNTCQDLNQKIRASFKQYNKISLETEGDKIKKKNYLRETDGRCSISAKKFVTKSLCDALGSAFFKI